MHKHITRGPGPDLSSRVTSPHPALPPAPDLAHSSVLHESWRSYFRGLPAGARILDIAAGIGALSLLAQEVSRARTRPFEVHSLDQAATLVAGPLLMDGIRFHARRYDKSTGFADGYFDAINVQWAPPDGDGAAPCLPELRRILKSSGRARFMFHALGGATHEECLGRMRAVEMLLDDLQLLEHARRMFETSAGMRATRKREVLRAATRALGSRQAYTNAAAMAGMLLADTPNPKAGAQILEVIADCWAQRGSLSLTEVQGRLDRMEGELRGVQERMGAACALAVDETRAHRIGKLFKGAGFSEVKVRPFREPQSGSLLAWDIEAA